MSHHERNDEQDDPFLKGVLEYSVKAQVELRKPTRRRCPWDDDEDKALMKCVSLHNVDGRPIPWKAVSISMQKMFNISRCNKSCRERYNNGLKPNIDISPMTKEEMSCVDFLVKIDAGRNFAAINRRLFNGKRSGNNIKTQ